MKSIILVFLITFGCLCCRGSASVAVAAPAAVASRGPALPLAGAASAFGLEPPLADVPSPSPEAFGNWIIGFVAVCSAAGTVLGLVNVFRPQPALHRQFADREEIKEQLRELRQTLEAWSKDHYKARGRMYRRINALENALSFIVGKMARDNDPDAERLERLLEKAEANEEGDE